MEKTDIRAVVKYMEKKGMTTNGIHVNMLLLLVEDSPFDATIKKHTSEF